MARRLGWWLGGVSRVVAVWITMPLWVLIIIIGAAVVGAFEDLPAPPEQPEPRP